MHIRLLAIFTLLITLVACEFPTDALEVGNILDGSHLMEVIETEDGLLVAPATTAQNVSVLVTGTSLTYEAPFVTVDGSMVEAVAAEYPILEDEETYLMPVVGEGVRAKISWAVGEYLYIAHYPPDSE